MIFQFFRLDKEHTAAGQQRMLTPHGTWSYLYFKGPCSSAPVLYFYFGLFFKKLFLFTCTTFHFQGHGLVFIRCLINITFGTGICVVYFATFKFYVFFSLNKSTFVTWWLNKTIWTIINKYQLRRFRKREQLHPLLTPAHPMFN